ncbi:MAG: class I SAM-dependent DNA methyltransferase [Polymorphobacter sp.]|uniref:class I SAM-dependent DNA methyltransferase n=1 Tax=Polymorphobacter sp. TaxID=1909290 RepID=UPI003A836A13
MAMSGGGSASVIDVYERHGAAWAAARSAGLVEAAWLARFCALMDRNGAVLDIGCGAGVPLARELLRRGFEVTGVDAAATMVALFSQNLPGTRVHLADMRALALGARFDGLLAWDSLFHLPGEAQRPMFARLAAHARPGAALMFSSGPAEGSAMGVLEGEPLYHGSLGAAEYRALLDRAGFDVVDHVVEDPACGGRTVWLARQRGG